MFLIIRQWFVFEDRGFCSRQHTSEMIVFIALVLGLFSVAQGGMPQPVVVGTQQPWNIKGDTLILDVGSLYYQGNHPMGPPVSDPSTCAAYCEKTQGCTAWTFCSSKTGCGSGCEQYVKSNPQLKTQPNDNPTVPNQGWYSLTAIKGFGPWGSTGGCLKNCSWSAGGGYVCNATGKWPYGMCSLKKLSNSAQPQYWSKNAGEGWVSGYFVLPAECRVISARACHRCLASSNPAACLGCASNSQIQPGLLNSLSGGMSTMLAADGCAACYNSSAPDKCTACLYSKQPCAACATQAENPWDVQSRMDVTSCIDCTNKYGASYSDACVGCGMLGANTAYVQKCMGCLDRASKVACNMSAWPPVCWNPQSASRSCATCVTSASSYETCVSCLTSKPYSDSCTSCATLNGTAKQAQCYACAKAAKSPYATCSDCLTYLTDPRAVDQCLACLTNPKASVEGKQWCYGCQNWCNTYETRGKCSQCLATQQDAYMQACSCNK